MLNKKDLLPLDAECSVCHQPIPKDRVHYGGVTCYSCRAFFRRNTQRDELPQCKAEQSCSITYIDRKQCSACRYFKCISIGMKPELVLTEEDKKRRFKKFLKKKEKDDQQPGVFGRDEDDYPAGQIEQKQDLPPLEPIQSKVCSFLTPSFRQNLHLLFNRQNTDLQPAYLEDRWNTSSAVTRDTPRTPRLAMDIFTRNSGVSKRAKRRKRRRRRRRKRKRRRLDIIVSHLSRDRVSSCIPVQQIIFV